MNNFTYIFENFISWSTEGYTEIVGFFFWPIIIAVVIGYVYLSNQSVITAAIAAIILFGAFASTGIFAGVGMFTMFFQGIVIIAFTGMVLLFLTRFRRTA